MFQSPEFSPDRDINTAAIATVNVIENTTTTTATSQDNNTTTTTTPHLVITNDDLPSDRLPFPSPSTSDVPQILNHSISLPIDPSIVDIDYQHPMTLQHAASSASSLGLNIVTAFETGLRLASVISTSSYHIAANINTATAGFADRSLTATAEALTAQVNSMSGGLSYEWQESLQERIQSGTSKLKEAVTSFSSGIDKALSVAHGLTSTGINWSLETVKRMDQGLDAALTSAGIAPTASGYRRRNGMLQAAHAMLEVLAPLSNASPLDVGRALGAVSMIQEASRMPYPPTRCTLIDLNQRQNRDLMNDLVYRYRQTLAVYSPGLLRLCRVGVKSGSSSDLIRELLGVEAEAILVKRDFSEVHHPAHFVILDHSSRSICVIIRGSTEAADVLTDFCCQPDATFGSHSGMQSSAASIDNHTRPTVHQLCEDHPDYKVIVEGHSLGGGTATLLCLLWLRDPVIAGRYGERIHCYSFGSPAVLPLGTASLYRDNITSVIYGHDVVARASWGSMTNLNNVLLYLCSKERPVLGYNNSTSPTTASASLRNSPMASASNITRLNHSHAPSRRFSFDSSPTRQDPSINGSCCPETSNNDLCSTASSITQMTDCPQTSSSSEETNNHLLSSNSPVPHLTSSVSLSSSFVPKTIPFAINEPTMAPLINQHSSPLISTNPPQPSPTASTSSSTPIQPSPSIPPRPPTGCRHAYLSEHLNSLTISTLLNLLEARNSLSSTAPQATREFWDSQIRLAASALQTLHSNENVLSVAGRCIIVMPVEHYILNGQPAPDFLTPGGCVLVELDDDDAIAQMSRDACVSRDAFSDHLPQHLATALGLRFPNRDISAEQQSEMTYFNNLIWTTDGDTNVDVDDDLILESLEHQTQN